MSSQLLEKITIVIFSFNRHKHLKRVINFWLAHNVQLLILDGSDKKLIDSGLKSQNVQYIHSQTSLYDRLLSSIDYIKTDFMILGCDDEFYLPSSLSACIDFLISQPTYSCCKGVALAFFEGKDKKKFLGRQVYQGLINLHLKQENPLHRIKYHFYNYTQAHLYSVCRTEQWKIICKYVFEKEYNFYAVWELQIEFLLMISGKSKVIPELMWMRNAGVPAIRGTSPSMSYNLEISGWWNSENYKMEKSSFLFRMKQACDELLINKNLEITEAQIEKMFEIYINRFYSKKKNLLRKFIDLVPSNVKKWIKIILNWEKFILKRRQMTFNNLRSLEEEANLLKKKGIFVNYEEINLIISAIKDH